MCFVCRDYGKYQGYKYILFENEVENMRVFVIKVIQYVRIFIDEVDGLVVRFFLVIEVIEGLLYKVVEYVLGF